MKQIVQSYSTGELRLADLPAPDMKSHSIGVKRFNSLVSVGTERYMLDLAKKSLVGKALARPDLVKQVVNKMRTEGPMEAYRQTEDDCRGPVPSTQRSSTPGIACQGGRHHG